MNLVYQTLFLHFILIFCNYQIFWQKFNSDFYFKVKIKIWFIILFIMKLFGENEKSHILAICCKAQYTTSYHVCNIWYQLHHKINSNLSISEYFHFHILNHSLVHAINYCDNRYINRFCLLFYYHVCIMCWIHVCYIYILLPL